MATIKSYTSLEQSRKLAEILPLESADMYYGYGKDKPEFLPIADVDIKYLSQPCWSLAALVSVLPDTITNNGGIAFELNIKKNIIEYSNPSLYLVYKSVKADNSVDSCVAMIEELNKLNLL